MTDSQPQELDDQESVKSLLQIDAIVKKNKHGNVAEIIFANPETYDDDLRHLNGLVELRAIDLSSTAVTSKGLAHCAAVTPLQKLYLGNTQVDDEGMRYIGRMKNLRELILPMDISDDGVKHLRGLRLRVLYIRHARITNDSVKIIAGMRSLRTLFIDGNKLTDECVADLSTLEGLKILGVYKTGITAAGLDQLRTALPDCRM
ncbi:MAG: hypothetical protein ACYC0X_33955 [Pirellulaceae bacterium]